MVEDVKKTGLLIYGDYFRPSLYEYVYDDTSKGIRLRRFGSPPLLHPRQRAVLQFVNKLPERHPYTTTASCDVKAGQPPNPNLMRPTFPVPEGTAFARQIGERFLLNRATALTEEQFSCLEELRGNENITLTAGTEGPVLTADSTSKVTTDGTLKTIVTRTNELKPIDLIAGGDKQLPQVRSLYGFNYFTGVVVSALRNPTFYKKLTDLSIVTSSDGKQTITKTYGVTSINGDLQIKPIAGLSFYFKGRDTNRPLRLFEALVPVPTVAFSLSTPADDFFVGGSHEVIRSIQIFYGGHFGRVNKLRDGLVDTTSADGPVTDKKFNHSVFVGLTFNINIVTKIFK
jgi:hypothetical protein